MSKHIIEAHGGQISVRSELGRGTTWTIYAGGTLATYLWNEGRMPSARLTVTEVNRYYLILRRAGKSHRQNNRG